jgi:hypothetical protein
MVRSPNDAGEPTGPLDHAVSIVGFKSRHYRREQEEENGTNGSFAGTQGGFSATAKPAGEPP